MLKLRTILLLIAVIFTATPSPVPASRLSLQSNEPNARVDASLLSTSGQVGYFVTLRQVADLRVSASSWAERGAAVYARLAQVAQASQAVVVTRLTELQRAGHVRSWRSYWIANALYVLGDRTAAADLAELPVVASITPSQ